jgi:uncharacterized membrane-anchored protein
MKGKKLIITLFSALALAQIAVPAGMILRHEKILKEGKDYRFRTEPVDPTDPFRGKYIILNFKADTFRVNDTGWPSREDNIFVLLDLDKDGYAKVAGLSKEEPRDNREYIKAKAGWIEEGLVDIEYPFGKFYMEESKAPEAEKIHASFSRDTGHTTYAIVRVYKGDAVLKNVFIDDIPIAEAVKRQRSSK